MFRVVLGARRELIFVMGQSLYCLFGCVLSVSLSLSLFLLFVVSCFATVGIRVMS